MDSEISIWLFEDALHKMPKTSDQSHNTLHRTVCGCCEEEEAASLREKNYIFIKQFLWKKNKTKHNLIVVIFPLNKKMQLK